MLSDIKLIILDRDGVINGDSESYIKSPDEFHPIQGSLAGIAALNRAGYLVTVATNQSGVGRNYYSLETLEAIHAKMTSLLAQEGGHFDAIQYCPHLPENNCLCRKPKSGMIKEILSLYPEIQAWEVLMVGDSLRDLEAAWQEHCQAVLVRTGKGVDTFIKHKDALKDVEIFDDLAAVVTRLLEAKRPSFPH